MGRSNTHHLVIKNQEGYSWLQRSPTKRQGLETYTTHQCSEQESA